MAAPARFPNGVTNTALATTLGAFGAMDLTKYHIYWNDFDTYTAADWTVTTTEAGTGSAATALTDADGGVLLITNDDADDDRRFFQKVGESFLFVAGKQLWFKSRFKVSNATQSDIIMGLQITDTTPLAVTDGVYFYKADDAATCDFIVTKNSTATTASAFTTLTSDTYVALGFHYNGVDAIKYYVDDVHIGTSAVTNLVDDEEMTISFGIQNGSAAVRTMSLDYIFVAKER